MDEYMLSEHPWMQLEPDENITQSLISRRYTLPWDSSAVMYSPPSDDPELSSYCTEKEMDLPAPQ